MADLELKNFLEELYRNYYRILLNKSFSMFDYRPEFRPLAEDCVQETFIRALLNADTLSKAPEPIHWLMTTCVHISMSERRKHSRRKSILNPVVQKTDEEPADPRDVIADWIAEEDLLSKKDQLLTSLTEQERAVYASVYENGRSARETADAVRTTEGGVYAALRRIRKKIRQLFLSLMLMLSRMGRM